MNILIVIILLCSFLVSYFFIKFITNIAIKLNIVDHPNDEVITHTKTIPLLGGSFLFIVFIIGLILILSHDFYWGIALGFCQFWP